MKVKVSKEELHECVKNAVTRIVNEEKNGKRWEGKTKSDFFETPSKHEKAKKNKFTKKDNKGNKGNRRWEKAYDDEDAY